MLVRVQSSAAKADPAETNAIASVTVEATRSRRPTGATLTRIMFSCQWCFGAFTRLRSGGPSGFRTAVGSSVLQPSDHRADDDVQQAEQEGKEDRRDHPPDSDLNPPSRSAFRFPGGTWWKRPSPGKEEANNSHDALDDWSCVRPWGMLPSDREHVSAGRNALSPLLVKASVPLCASRPRRIRPRYVRPTAASCTTRRTPSSGPRRRSASRCSCRRPSRPHRPAP